jgi:hypothetical protein
VNEHRPDAAAPSNLGHFVGGHTLPGSPPKWPRPLPFSSPFKVTGLKPGKHLFEVVARYKSQVDPTPAIAHFSVPASSRRHHRDR